MNKLNPAQQYAWKIYQTLLTMFDEGEVTEIEPTAFFQGLILANNMLHKELTNKDGDLLDFLSLNQRLVFQYLQENGKEKDETM